MIGRPLARRLGRASMLAVLLIACGRGALAQGPYDPEECDAPGDAPDVILGDIYQIRRWGTLGAITGFSIGTFSCNVGTCWLDWIAGDDDNRHPTIGQNLFRVKDGRIEQLGQSWLKHGYFAACQDMCETGCSLPQGEHLGVNCSDPYTAVANGSQQRLGPKFEVSATTGDHPHPVTDHALTGSVIYKRLQVPTADIDPALNPGARWFFEGQYVAADDAAAGNKNNNSSYREVEPAIDPSSGSMSLDFITGVETQQTRPGILAWSDNDPEVEIDVVDDPDGGRFYVGAKATDLGGGVWHYEYAIQNIDSDRAAGSVSVPVPASSTITNIGFHDVPYHSGEPFSGISWNFTDGSAGSVTWASPTFATNPNANALRWGTLYNYRFDCDRPPGTNLVGLGLFKPGNGAGQLFVATIAPESCNADGTCDAGETCFSCADCTDDGPDFDGDGVGFCTDCEETDPDTWATPGEVLDVRATRGPAGELNLSWAEPAEPGSTRPIYETLRTTDPGDFQGIASCLFAQDRSARSVRDSGAPFFRQPLYYLVRARTACVAGVGTTGTDSFGQPRLEAACQ